MAVINIVCDEANNGWIYSQFIEQFKKYSDHQVLVNAKSGYNLVHYLPYYNVPEEPFHPATAWFSHMETSDPLKTKFTSAAQMVDFAISHSKKYADLLLGLGMTNVKQIMPGVDFNKFKQRVVRKDQRNKLVVGYIGRQYTSTNRKNPGLLKAIGGLPFVELRSTGGKVPAEKMPAFYADLDIICQTSLIEGGSMSITEGLSVGVPIICYDGVGVANEFNTGVIKIPFNDERAFLAEINNIWVNKKHILFNTKECMTKMLEQVKPFTWKNFVKSHDEIWENIVKK